MTHTMTYVLDLPTLLEHLSPLSVTLQTELAPGNAVLGEAGRGWVRIEGGQIRGCGLQTRSGKRLEGEQALERLRVVQQWQVVLPGEAGSIPHSRPASSLPVFPQHATHPDSYVFRQARSLDQVSLEQLTHQERILVRMVLVMINGERTVAQIKAHLSFSPEGFARGLATLQHLGLIEAVVMTN